MNLIVGKMQEHLFDINKIELAFDGLIHDIEGLECPRLIREMIPMLIDDCVYDIYARVSNILKMLEHLWHVRHITAADITYRFHFM